MKKYKLIESKVEKLLTPKRFKHSQNVKISAMNLAKIYNVDEEKVRIAAITHDCAKCFSDDELLKLADAYSLNIDPIQRNFVQLLHGPIGAKYSVEHLNIEDDDIYNAIYYHTTGRNNMSSLEKIIYLADMIEETRNFKGVEDIRKAALVSLDDALIMSCNSTINYLTSKNFLIHPLTIEFRNSLLLKGGSFDD